MKKWYESKTMWANLVGGVIVLLEYVGTINVVDPEVLAGVLIVVNIVLRVVTSQPIARTIK